MVAHLLCFVREVIRIHADAVAADHAGAKGQKVPFAAGGFQYVQCVYPQAGKDDGKLVDQGNVQIALGVFNDFGGFCHLDAAGLVRPCANDLAVQRIHRLGHLGGAAAGDFFDGSEGVDFVPRVDALGAVAAEKILIEFQPRGFFQLRNADFFSSAWEHGGFIDHHIPFFKHAADGLAGLDQGGEIRAMGIVHRRRYSHDEDPTVTQVVQLAAKAQVLGGLELFRAAFQRVILAPLQFGHAGLVDIKADDRAVFAKFNGQGQADIAQANQGNGCVVQVHDFVSEI